MEPRKRKIQVASYSKKVDMLLALGECIYCCKRVCYKIFKEIPPVMTFPKSQEYFS